MRRVARRIWGQYTSTPVVVSGGATAPLTPPSSPSPVMPSQLRHHAELPAVPAPGEDDENLTTKHSYLHDPATENLVKAIDKEIDDETLRVDKEEPMSIPSWSLHHEEGTSYFTMKRDWKKSDASTDEPEHHFVKCQLTTRDPSLDPECDIRGEHFPFTLQVRKGKSVVDLQMDVIEGEVIVDSIAVFEQTETDPVGTAQSHIDRAHQYRGPNLDEAEEEFLDGLQAWLSEREIDDQFGEFIGQQSCWVEQGEYERWLKEMRRFVLA